MYLVILLLVCTGLCVGETGASPPCFFPTRRERAFYKLEGYYSHMKDLCPGYTQGNYTTVGSAIVAIAIVGRGG